MLVTKILSEYPGYFLNITDIENTMLGATEKVLGYLRLDSSS